MMGKKVFVGLSGGVDSSVAALRLINEGYDVVGVFIKVWHPDFLVCNWEQERLDAMRVAAHLDIPFLTCDAEVAYRDDVAKYFIDEYKVGRTPNPDVMCNKHVKFGAFMDFAKAKGANFIATGHYAQKLPDGEMYRGVDNNKDQTYFLWSLSNEQLNFTLLPVGDSAKEDIRKEALAAGIPTASKKDSQGICFLGHIDIKDFLSHYTDLKVGPILNEAGDIIGHHEGSLIYTIGQRHGFSVSTKVEGREAYYVIAKDLVSNTITVSAAKPLLKENNVIILENILLRTPLTLNEIYEAQSRYRQTPFKVQIMSLGDDNITLKILDKTEAMASGQSCVLYSGLKCIGGGIIV
jgi:tRNA-specific 2-thiouridylase